LLNKAQNCSTLMNIYLKANFNYSIVIFVLGLCFYMPALLSVETEKTGPTILERLKATNRATPATFTNNTSNIEVRLDACYQIELPASRSRYSCSSDQTCNNAKTCTKRPDLEKTFVLQPRESKTVPNISLIEQAGEPARKILKSVKASAISGRDNKPTPSSSSTVSVLAAREHYIITNRSNRLVIS
jgi:hypothetical protein